MANEMTISSERQGLVQKFTIVHNRLGHNYTNDILESSQYIIDDLVTIRFGSSKSSPDLRIFTKKYKKVHSAMKINVTCKNMQNSFSEQWFCTDGWSDEKILLNVMNGIYMRLNNTDVYTYYTEVSVNAYELTVMGLPLYNDDLFTDFKLSAADGSVGVHKAVLAVHSDMFKAMLSGEWKETVEGRIEVAGASLQTLQALKDYLYLGTLPEEGLQTHLQIAIRFFIESLKMECIIKLAQNVKPEDYFQLQDFARDNEIIELTCALLQLTPKEVIASACEMMTKQLPEAGNKE